MYRIASPHGSGVYAAVGNGHVEVEQGDRRGLFDGDGVWLEGELRTADPQMCRWVSTANLAGMGTRHAQSVASLITSEVSQASQASQASRAEVRP